MHVYATILVLLLGTSALAAPTTAPVDPRFTVVDRITSDDFSHGTDLWTTELEKGGTISAADGILDVDVPAGASVWLKQKLTGPVLIQYRVTAVSAGGPNDRVSDVNCFWMAGDSRNKDDFFAVNRSGKFSDYDQLLTYYVGYGGNTNTTTRFRRYIGKKDDRPLLPENDRKEKIVPNQEMLIQLVAADRLVQFYCDGKKLFEMDDPDAYTSGYFAFRTVKSHLRIRNFSVYRLETKMNDKVTR